MSQSHARGLTAEELAQAVAELRTLVGAVVLDAVSLVGTGGHDDVLLVLRGDEATAKSFVHVALGAQRARVTTTARRFAKAAHARGPGADLLRRELEGAHLSAADNTAGERRCIFTFATERGPRSLAVELFGARGLWALCDEGGVALTMSRAVETAVRTLRRGDTYVPPPPAPPHASPRTEPPSRFEPPVLAAIDAHFTAIDLENEQERAATGLRQAAERALQKARTKEQGLRRQLADVDRPADLRATADMMLAYAHTVERGARSMSVPDADGDGERSIELDPSKPVALQASQLYDKARRLDDGRAITERRHAEAQAAQAALAAITAELEALPEVCADDDRLGDLRQRLQALGVLPKAAAPTPGPTRGGGRGPTAVPFRRFESAEGYAIFVGRNNSQNDELTMRFANGNDLWLHVGGGRPGSHVVVRLPKQKTASLETLLDAATLAVHFSKARGEARIDVVYTYKKHVRKPKGLPAGAVVPSQTKTVTVLHDARRLSRLLDSAASSDA